MTTLYYKKISRPRGNAPQFAYIYIYSHKQSTYKIIAVHGPFVHPFLRYSTSDFMCRVSYKPS